MQSLTDYMRHGATIRALAPDHATRVLGFSHNLRALRDYARKFAPACIITSKRNSHDRDPGGILRIIYSNGAIGAAEFASHAILIDWVRNRRTWRGAEMRHLDGTMGYLTRPGLIAGN